MAIVMLPAGSGSKEQIDANSYAQIWKNNPKKEYRFIPAKEQQEIKKSVGEALIKGENPFEYRTAFFAGKIYFEELEALVGYYINNEQGFSGFTAKIARVKEKLNNEENKYEWRKAWSIVAMKKDKTLYDGEEDMILVYCFPYDRDIPPTQAVHDYYTANAESFNKIIAENHLEGKAIADRLGDPNL